jgi:hypothetical protein
VAKCSHSNNIFSQSQPFIIIALGYIIARSTKRVGLHNNQSLIKHSNIITPQNIKPERSCRRAAFFFFEKGGIKGGAIPDKKAG